MRPLRGELEQATQNVVNKVRFAGDKAVFWLDTTGWLEEETKEDSTSSTTDHRDVFYDTTSTPPRYRLTTQGSQRVAIFLHMHVCRYLAAANEKCAFLPPQVYQGEVFDPKEADFDQYLEEERGRKLRDMFWKEGEEEEVG